jgi:leucyl-tRNA synthetase
MQLKKGFLNDLFPSTFLGKIAQRICRNERNIKDPKKVQLYRFADPLLGPRKIPSIEKPLEGKIEILASEIFKINIETKEVFLENKSGKIPLGDSIIVRI